MEKGGRDLFPDVLVAVRVDETKADQEHVGLGIRNRADPVVTFISGGIPKTKRNSLSVDDHIGRVVVKH